MITISLANNFDWNTYEKSVYDKIIRTEVPVEILWDLREMTKIPHFDIIVKQVALMKKEREHIIQNIITNTIIVSSNTIKQMLLWIFKFIYTPENPTVIFTAEEWANKKFSIDI